MPPVVIAAGIAAAGAIGGAAIASSGAKRAAKTQAEAAQTAAQTETDYGNRALDLQEQMYNQTRSDLEPYRTVGSQAITTLGSLMGLSGGGGGGTTTATSAAPALSAPISTAIGGARERNATAVTGRAVRRDAFTADQTNLEQGDNRADREARRESARARTLSSVAGNAGVTGSAYTPQNTSGYVAMRAPTGEVQSVPASQVDYFRGLGATLA